MFMDATFLNSEMAKLFARIPIGKLLSQRVSRECILFIGSLVEDARKRRVGYAIFGASPGENWLSAGAGGSD